MNCTCYAAVVYHCRLQLNDGVKPSNDLEHELYHTCVSNPGCLISHNWLHTPDCKVLTENITVQIMLYFLWGNVLCAGSLSFSAICSQARPAVLVAVIWVIMSGFGANLVLTQFIEQGPSVAATILQIIPSMGLFRG